MSHCALRGGIIISRPALSTRVEMARGKIDTEENETENGRVRKSNREREKERERE